MISRRNAIALMGAPLAARYAAAQPVVKLNDPPPLDSKQEATRDKRMKWWHDARFGMFIHWGLYSVIGRHEWVMEREAIPVREYELIARQFKPKPNAAREWAKLAKAAGQKYMVMTTKHHEGFCLFDSKLTNYCAPKQGPGRDLVAEFVEAARAEGITPGFYYSLMDWHHPDGARCATDEAARRRFVDYIHGQIRELLTNYGKIGVLWYDVNWPLNWHGWESVKMNQMVFDLQPDIIVNDRNGLRGDFSTPEQRIVAETGGRAWESCMTLNDSWGYHANDDNWKSPKTVVRNLLTCAKDGGNYLLNIGPRGDGSIPEPTIDCLRAAGRWVNSHGPLVHDTDPGVKVTRSQFAQFTRKGNTLFVHSYYWPGSVLNLAGIPTKALSAKLYGSNVQLKIQQTDLQLKITGLPEKAPDPLISTVAIEFEAPPTQDTDNVRKTRERLSA